MQRGAAGPITVDRLYNVDRSITKQKGRWSQELRLASDYDGDWNFVLAGSILPTSPGTVTIYSSAVELTGQLLNLDPRACIKTWPILTSWTPYATFGEL
ncbi:MAG: hypothetical protein IPG64_16480 [Haliea sp.]|nr:hypothetical protein [Haliea sp.]